MKQGKKIKYLGLVNELRYMGALHRRWLPVSIDAKAVTLSLANGGSGGKRAFAAFVQFLDKDDSLILPPYQGFSQPPRGAPYFYVAGGEAESPVVTTHPFTAPPMAATLQIELRPWAFRDRPRLAAEPRVIAREGAAGTLAARPDVHVLPVTGGGAGAVTLSLANGHQGGDKAFVVAVRFLDEGGGLVLSPYAGFAASERFPAYFYVKGGRNDVPSKTTYTFAAPMGAAAIEIELHPWRVKEKAQLAAEPIVTSSAPGEPRQAPPQSGMDALAAQLATPPMGSQIAEQVDGGRIRIVGIVGDGFRGAWSGRVADAALPFDGYDRDWDRTDPSHLVIDVAHLHRAFGWENALTLRDPAATVEMAVMLEKARAAGIRTVLVEPEEPHRFPLLSRIAHLFDVMLKPGEATSLEP